MFSLYGIYCYHIESSGCGLFLLLTPSVFPTFPFFYREVVSRELSISVLRGSLSEKSLMWKGPFAELLHFFQTRGAFGRAPWRRGMVSRCPIGARSVPDQCPISARSVPDHCPISARWFFCIKTPFQVSRKGTLLRPFFFS